MDEFGHSGSVDFSRRACGFGNLILPEQRESHTSGACVGYPYFFFLICFFGAGFAAGLLAAGAGFAGCAFCAGVAGFAGGAGAASFPFFFPFAGSSALAGAATGALGSAFFSRFTGGGGVEGGGGGWKASRT